MAKATLSSPAALVERAARPHDGDARMIIGAGLDRDEECELAAARAAEKAEPPRVDAEPARVSPRVAYAGRHVGDRCGMVVIRTLAEVQADHDQPRGGESA